MNHNNFPQVRVGEAARRKPIRVERLSPAVAICCPTTPMDDCLGLPRRKMVYRPAASRIQADSLHPGPIWQKRTIRKRPGDPCRVPSWTSIRPVRLSNWRIPICMRRWQPPRRPGSMESTIWNFWCVPKTMSFYIDLPAKNPSLCIHWHNPWATTIPIWSDCKRFERPWVGKNSDTNKRVPWGYDFFFKKGEIDTIEIKFLSTRYN